MYPTLAVRLVSLQREFGFHSIARGLNTNWPRKNTVHSRWLRGLPIPGSASLLAIVASYVVSCRLATSANDSVQTAINAITLSRLHGSCLFSDVLAAARIPLSTSSIWGSTARHIFPYVFSFIENYG